MSWRTHSVGLAIQHRSAHRPWEVRKQSIVRIDRYKEIGVSFSAGTESQHGLVAVPRCCQRARSKKWD